MGNSGTLITAIFKTNNFKVALLALEHIDRINDGKLRTALDCEDPAISKATLHKWWATNVERAEVHDESLCAAI